MARGEADMDAAASRLDKSMAKEKRGPGNVGSPARRRRQQLCSPPLEKARRLWRLQEGPGRSSVRWEVGGWVSNMMQKRRALPYPDAGGLHRRAAAERATLYPRKNGGEEDGEKENK